MVGIRDFPGGPVVKILHSNAGGAGSVPCWGAKIPCTSRPKHHNVNNSSNVVTNSVTIIIINSIS